MNWAQRLICMAICLGIAVFLERTLDHFDSKFSVENQYLQDWLEYGLLLLGAVFSALAVVFALGFVKRR